MVSSWDLMHSPFASVMGINHVPSMGEMLRLKALLAVPHTELDQLELEIARTQLVLDGLLRQKEEIKNYIEAHQALMSPIRQIPSETLADIFVWCLPADRNATRSLKEAPLLLTTICRNWRQVALDTPRLWTSLHIFLPPHMSNIAVLKRAIGVKTWLQRSGSLPLSISFHVKPLFGPPPNITTTTMDFSDRLKLLIRTLVPFGHRFGNLFLSLPSTERGAFNDLSMCQFPILQSFRVRDANIFCGSFYAPGPWNDGSSSENASRVPFAPLLTQMQALKRLEVAEISVRDGSHLTLPINWGLLTDLNLQSGDSTTNQCHGVRVTEAFDILRKTSNLQNLQICIALMPDHPFDSTSLGMVHLPHLGSIRFKFMPCQLDDHTIPAQVCSVFQYISPPSLKLLSVVWDHCFPMGSALSGIPFHTLETLEIAMGMTSEALTGWLSCVPELTSFKFNDLGCSAGTESLFPFTNTFCDSHLFALTPSQDNPSPLCPKLTTFRMINHLHLPTETSISSSALLGFVQARAPTLKTFDLFFDRDQSFAENDLIELRKLKKNGLQMRLHNAKYPLPEDLPSDGLHPRTTPQLPFMAKRNPMSDMEGVFGTDRVV
ncbi:hypothetical protein F5876DRAFT_82673 [Lentinula aff. lateritia]|uniref:Uncharacterized protein n=1 Tax=Lentinula aff. lateritia TaxID=2804960 RepID=A0ACC1TJR5_9AGAR|nr:hypothetical protein F5876DRAFT_82673 [Lentinula aff. lateritia]